MTGMSAVSGAALTRRVASHPSTSGMFMFMRMRLGFSALAISTPSFPSTAITTWNPRRWSHWDRASRFSLVVFHDQNLRHRHSPVSASVGPPTGEGPFPGRALIAPGRVAH